jgi:ABC-type amino acid transport substrate-binding protein
VNPNRGLNGLSIGVLANSTNEIYLNQRHPEAKMVRYEGPTGRVDAINAVEQGDIDAFLGDDVLTISEVLYENRSVDNLTLVPELPLTCEFYGLALPNDDPEWVSFVNAFLNSDAGTAPWEERLGEYAPYAMDTLSYCLNR